MVNTTSQLEHLQPIKLKVIKIYPANTEVPKTKGIASPSSSSSGVATSLVSSPAASSTKKQFLIPPPNSLIAEIDVKSVKRANHQKSTASQSAYKRNNVYRSLQSSSFLLSPKSSTYSSEREPDGASAEDLPFRETSSNRSTNSSSKQRSEAIIKARGAAAGVDSFESPRFVEFNSKRHSKTPLKAPFLHASSPAQRRLDLDEGNSSNTSNSQITPEKNLKTLTKSPLDRNSFNARNNLEGKGTEATIRNQQTAGVQENSSSKISENVLLKVERVSDGKSGNLLLYGEALRDHQLIGEDKCYVFNNLLQYHSSRKSQAHNIQFMMAYPLRTSIVEISSKTRNYQNNDIDAATTQSSEQQSLSSPTASSNSVGIQSFPDSSYQHRKNSTRKTVDNRINNDSRATGPDSRITVDSTTITQHHHHHHHWLVKDKKSSTRQPDRQKIERKVEKMTESSLALRTSPTDISNGVKNITKTSKTGKLKPSKTDLKTNNHKSLNNPKSPNMSSQNNSETVNSNNHVNKFLKHAARKSRHQHPQLRFHHTSKNSSGSGTIRSKQPSASAALAKTMENDDGGNTRKNLKSNYIANVAIYGNSSLNTSSPTSETGSSGLSQNKEENLITSVKSVDKYQKLPVIPSNLLESRGRPLPPSLAATGNITNNDNISESDSSSAFRRYHSRSSSVPRCTNF